MKKTASLLILATMLAPAALAAEGGFMGGLMYSLKDPVTHVTFLTTVAFLALAAKFGAFKAIFGGLDARANAIRSELEQASTLREQAAAALALAEQRARDADKEAAEIVEQAKADAQMMLEQARRDLSEKISRREAQAANRISRAESEAASDVRRAAAEAATAAARTILSQETGVDQFEAAARDIERALS